MKPLERIVWTVKHVLHALYTFFSLVLFYCCPNNSIARRPSVVPMMELNREAVLNELSKYERGQELSPLLESLLARIAKTGDTMFPWGLVKSVLLHKLENCLREFQPCQPGDTAALTRLLQLLEGFHSAPFTIQRLCELVTDPHQHYKRADKFLRGLEKNILVVSTVEPRSLVEQPAHLNGAEPDSEPSSEPESSSSKRPFAELYGSDQEDNCPVPAKVCKLEDSPPHNGSPTPPSDSLGELKLDPAPEISSSPPPPLVETASSVEPEPEEQLAPVSSPGELASDAAAQVETPAADLAEAECPTESSSSFTAELSEPAESTSTAETGDETLAATATNSADITAAETSPSESEAAAPSLEEEEEETVAPPPAPPLAPPPAPPPSEEETQETISEEATTSKEAPADVAPEVAAAANDPPQQPPEQSELQQPPEQEETIKKAAEQD